MCLVSGVGDQWSRKEAWPDWPQIYPFPPQPNGIPITSPLITRAEFDQLKREVEQMKSELEAARAQDIADGNPDCEMEEKVAILKATAKAFGVDLNGVFPND